MGQVFESLSWFRIIVHSNGGYMWPALTRLRDPIKVFPGYILPLITEEERLDLCNSWQLTNSDKYRLQLNQRRRIKRQHGLWVLLKLVFCQLCRNIELKQSWLDKLHLWCGFGWDLLTHQLRYYRR